MMISYNSMDAITSSESQFWKHNGKSRIDLNVTFVILFLYLGNNYTSFISIDLGHLLSDTF